MDTKDFDTAVVAAVFEQAGLVGWRDTTLIEAARQAGITDLPRLRLRYPGKSAVLLRFGVIADQAALAALQPGGTPREALFDLLMARFDVLQQHRPGVLALISALRTDPATAAMLWAATLRSMAWMLDAAAIPTAGITGILRVHGLAAIWAYALRAWERDEGSDLPATMAAVDRGLDRAVQAEGMLPGHRPTSDAAPILGTTSLDTTVPDTTVLDTPPSLSGTEIAAAEDGPAVL